MVGPPDGNVMSPSDAKARLLELGRKESALAKFLRDPVVRAGVLLVGGASLRRVIGRGGTKKKNASLRRIAVLVGLAAAPLLIERLMRGIARRASARSGSAAAPPASDLDPKE